MRFFSILAAAGGGSSGFGGGSSGGGGYSGGGYSGGGSGSGGGSPVFVVFVIVAVLLFFVASIALAAYRARKRERAAAARDIQVRGAAIVAADADAMFEPDTVEAQAAGLFTAIQAAWSENDIASLESLVGAELMVEWRRRLEDFRRKGWHNVIELRGAPRVQYVGLVNVEGDGDDRVVVRVRADLRDVVVARNGSIVKRSDSDTERVTLVEFWTLEKRAIDDGFHWTLASVESDVEGSHHLGSRIVADAAEGEGVELAAIAEAARAEGDAGDAVGELLSPAFSGTAREAALDLSVVDARFAPHVMGAAVSATVSAWLRAIDGPDTALEAAATPDAARQLLYPTTTEAARLVIRGARVEAFEITEVRATRQPVEVVLALTVSGVQYVEDRDTAAVIAGDKRTKRTTHQRWTLALADAAAAMPWRVIAAEGAAP